MQAKYPSLPSGAGDRRKFLRNALVATATATTAPSIALAAEDAAEPFDDKAVASHVDPYVNITDYGADPTRASTCQEPSRPKDDRNDLEAPLDRQQSS